jgi:hypothetical protein
MIIGNNSHVPQFYWINLGKPETSFSMFLTFRDPNEVQITRKFVGASREQDFGAKVVQQGSQRGPNEHAPYSQIPWTRGVSLFPPHYSDAVDLRLDGFVLT